MSLQNVWSDILSRIKNNKEKQVVMELQTLVHRLEVSMQQMQQSRSLTTQYETLWDKLLVCRRSDLMAAVPLAGERLEQLRCTTAALSTAAQQLLPALQSACGMLSAFAAVNRATAGELEQAGALTLALAKLQLAGLEDQLLVALQHAAASCTHQLTAAAAAAKGDAQQQQQHGGCVARPAASASSSGNHASGPVAAAAAAVATALPHNQQQQLADVVEQQQRQKDVHAQRGSRQLADYAHHLGLQQQQQLQVQHTEGIYQQMQSSVSLQQQQQQQSQQQAQQQLQDGGQVLPATAYAAAAAAKQALLGSATTAPADWAASAVDGLAASHQQYHHQQQQQQHFDGTTAAAAADADADAAATDVVSGSLPSQELLAVLAAAEAGRATHTTALEHLQQAAAAQPCSLHDPQQQQQASNAWRNEHAIEVERATHTTAPANVKQAEAAAEPCNQHDLQQQQQQPASNHLKDVDAKGGAAAHAVGVLQPLEGSLSHRRAVAHVPMQEQQQQQQQQQQGPVVERNPKQHHAAVQAGADCSLGGPAGRHDLGADHASRATQQHKTASVSAAVLAGAETAAAAAVQREAKRSPCGMFDYACGQAVAGNSHPIPSMYTQAE